MERRRSYQRVSSAAAADDLAVVKAAAWAWYQRSSGEGGKPIIREFDLASRNSRLPRPSRYKLEAIAAAASSSSTESSPFSTEPPSASVSPARTENSLLDPYEIERITRDLDCLIVANSRATPTSGGGGRKKREPPPGETAAVAAGGRKMAAKMNGFWLRHAIGLCGSRGSDVVAEAEVVVLVGGRRRWHPPRFDR